MEGRRECEPTWILGLARPYSTCKGIRGNSPHACSASRKPALNDGHAVITTAEGTYGFYNSMSCCHFDVTSFCSPQSPHQNLTAAGHPLSPSFDISLPVFLSSSNDVVKCSTEPQALLLRGGGRPNASPEDALRVPGGMKSTAECCKMLADTYDAGVLHASTSLHLEIRDSGVPESFRNIGSFRTSTSAAEELYDLRDEPLVPQSSSSDKFRHCSEHDADLREGYDITGGFSHMIPSEPLLQAVEARGMDHFSAHTVVVADTHPELDSHMSGTRSPIHPETQEEAWSDIVLTRGQDPGSSVVGSAVVGTAKVRNEAQAQPGSSLSIAEQHAHHEGFVGFCPCVVATQHSLQVRSRGREFPTVSSERDIPDVEGNCLRTRVDVLGRPDPTDGALSLPARLLQHICQRVRAYDQQRTNKSHLLIVGSTALIGLTFAVLLVCVAHSLLDKNTGDGNRFFS